MNPNQSLRKLILRNAGLFLCVALGTLAAASLPPGVADMTPTKTECSI